MATNTTRYRAFFMGGPLDGQERVLDDRRLTLRAPVPKRSVSRAPNALVVAEPGECVDYALVITYWDRHLLVYSLFNLEETVERFITTYVRATTCKNLGD